MRPIALLVPLLLLAGCLQATAPTTLPMADPDDGISSLSIQVVDAVTNKSLSKAEIELRIVGQGVVRKLTDDDGRTTLNVKPVPSCSVSVSRSGYQGGGAAIDCRKDQSFRIPLKPVAATGSGSAPPGTNVPPAQQLSPPPAGQFRLSGFLLDAVSGAPVEGARVRLDPPNGPTNRTDADGFFTFIAAPGLHMLEVEATCLIGGEFEVDLANDLAVNLQLQRDAVVPGAPAGLRMTSGPGPGMVALAWNAVPDVSSYLLLRGEPPVPLVQLGNSLSYGVHGAQASDKFWVAAQNGCGFTGPRAGPVSAEPMAGGAAVDVAGLVPDSPNVREFAYPAFDAALQPAGDRTWRTVLGTGNCCENYLSTTADGRIIDIGGETFYQSLDAGATWQRVVPLAPPLCGEGAGIPAPDGDIVGIDWIACLPIMDDQVLAMKYSKATNQWFSQVVPLHSPFYDRPWMGVVKGPFIVDGMIVPYLSFAIGGYPSKEVMLVSLDGLHYVKPSSSSLDALARSVSLPALDLSSDGDRDWTQAPVSAGMNTMDRGLALRFGLTATAGLAVLKDAPTWARAVFTEATVPDRPTLADSAGTLHSVVMTRGSFTYSWSHDGGRNWAELKQPIVGGSAANWDFKSHAGLDQTVVAVKVEKSDGRDVFQVYRFTGLDATPHLKEVLQVGLGDHPWRGAVTGGGSRFDFMTTGLLPDGKVVLSFGDSKHTTPAIAIER